MIVGARGNPQMIVSDNGTEFTSHAMLVWRRIMRQLALHRARPTDGRTAYIESFDGRMRDELLNESLFIVRRCRRPT
jgi:transposase InsO family protein